MSLIDLKQLHPLAEEIKNRENVEEARAYGPDAIRKYILVKIDPSKKLRTSSLKNLCENHGFPLLHSERRNGVLALAFYDQKNKQAQFDWPGQARHAFQTGVLPA